MRFDRLYTKNCAGRVLDAVKWTRRDITVKGQNGKTVFEILGVEVPDFWSDRAAQILASHYCRKAGVPVRAEDADHDPALRAAAFEGEHAQGWEIRDGIVYHGGKPMLGAERSLKQVAHRLALAWTRAGAASGVVPNDAAEAQPFYDEVLYMLVHQIAAPNSPQWFNTGLADAYGIRGTAAQGQSCFEPDGTVRQAEDAYTRPQASACFIQSVDDRLTGEGGIMDLWAREATLFKYGSGTGTNFSTLRAANEPLSSGGKSSGLMSWLKIGDAAAGAIKSGGTTRRAAKMVILDADHPDILDFVRLKAREELKVRAMIEGAKRFNDSDGAYAKRIGLALTSDYLGETYQTVTGQNANYSVRLSDEFMRQVRHGEQEWCLKRRTDGGVVSRVRARDVFDEIVTAAWRCADPGVQFDDTIQAWNTCPNSGRINATNPCSEYVWHDDTACNLASLNLGKFYSDETRQFDVEAFRHAVRLWTVVLDVTVGMASYPSAKIAAGSWRFRTLGLGYANLGATLMRMGLPYDSDAARAVACAITSVLTGGAYAASAEMAEKVGPFPEYSRNAAEMARVLRNHRTTVDPAYRFGDLAHPPVRFRPDAMKVPGLLNPQALADAAVGVWEHASPRGYRNAQVTVVAPTGTIGFVMDCDTTGIEPDFALLKYKYLASGGSMTYVNESVRPALRNLGYAEDRVVRLCDLLAKQGEFRPGDLDDAHLPVFDCAVAASKDGRFIRPMAHVEMMAAVQGLISGAISKTVNMPNSASLLDVAEVYTCAWTLGLKAVALYRDGCKSQPLNTSGTKDDVPAADDAEVAALRDRVLVLERMLAAAQADRGTKRRRLPDDARSLRHKFSISTHEGYLHVGLFDDGSPGEVFIKMSKGGSTMAGLADSFAISLSMLLQHGVPLDVIVRKFMHQRFAPEGITNNRSIPFAKSLVDYVARYLGNQFIPGFVESGEALQRPPETAVHERQPEAAEMVAAGSSVAAMAAAGHLHGDVPPCSVCGTLTVRNGMCYKCPQCGHSEGCS